MSETNQWAAASRGGRGAQGGELENSPEVAVGGGDEQLPRQGGFIHCSGSGDPYQF